MPTLDLTKLITAEDKAAAALAAACAALKARRDQAIAAGITVSGMAVATDDLSQQRITGAALAASLDGDYSVNWKTEAGFVELSAAQVLAVAQAVRAHVQACFDREAELLPLIEAADDPASVEIDGGWPG